MWPNHGECNGVPHCVPFGLLATLEAFASGDEKPFIQTPPYLPMLKAQVVRPRAPNRMKVRRLPGMVLFEGRKLSIGFSLNRPMILHLGWDALGQGNAGRNRLLGRSWNHLVGLSGPHLRTLHLDAPAYDWTGRVSVRGAKVMYQDLRSNAGPIIDATFEVSADGFTLELRQSCDEPLPVVEFSPWQLVWNLNCGMTAPMALPTLQPGRNGDVHLPMLWASDGVGCLSCRQIDGEPVRFQVESNRTAHCVSGGFSLDSRPDEQHCQFVEPGTRSATFEWKVTNVDPQVPARAARPGKAIDAHWASIYSCFRPELGGFSNHAASVNCHVNQHAASEIVIVTRPPKVGPDPLELFRFTIERGILGGGGYGFWRNLYLDSDPILIASAGRIHQARPDVAWLRRIEPGLREAVERIVSTIGPEGLSICHDLSGNSGSFRWSSNAMDVVGFGHMDGYVNAWTYRGLRNAAAMLEDLGDAARARRCRESATHLREGFARHLLNAQTGWVAAWRSRDGELHDHASLWVNGPVCAFGLLEPPVARKSLAALEKLRQKMGAGSGHFGLPCNLLPTRDDDHMLVKMRSFLSPSFETFTDGSMAASFAPFYLRALSIQGLRRQAKRLAAELEEGFALGHFNGGFDSGIEFRRWDGVPTGYEGTFVNSFSVLYGIGIEKGLFAPPEPEWWPANG